MSQQRATNPVWD